MKVLALECFFCSYFLQSSSCAVSILGASNALPLTRSHSTIQEQPRLKNQSFQSGLTGICYTALTVFLFHSHVKQITSTKCLKIVLHIQKYKKCTVFGALFFIIHLRNIHISTTNTKKQRRAFIWLLKYKYIRIMYQALPEYQCKKTLTWSL